MGIKGTFAKSRSRDAHQRSVRRSDRAQRERERRRGEDTAARLVYHGARERRMPTAEEQALLVGQFAEACRLAGPSLDLCTLIHHCAAAGETAAAAGQVGTKRAREPEPEGKGEGEGRGPARLAALAEALLQTQSAPLDAAGEVGEDEDPRTVLNDILQDESGARVVAALLAALHSVEGLGELGERLAGAIAAEYEENEGLQDHHVACRVLSALVRHGGEAVRGRVLLLMEQRAQTPAAVAELLTNRHAAGTVLHLLQAAPAQAGRWLRSALGLGAARAHKRKGRGGKEEDPGGAAVSGETLLGLINDPVSCPVLLALVGAVPREAFLSALSVNQLLQSKRGVGFLTRLLAVDGDGEGNGDGGAGAVTEAEATGLLDALLAELGPALPGMCTDKRANFVCQRLLRLIPHTGAAAGANLRRAVGALGGGAAVADLAYHAIGVHTAVALVEAALHSADRAGAAAALEEVAGLFVRKDTVRACLTEQHSSLVIRQLMPLVARRQPPSAVGAALQAAVELQAAALLYDSIGNLVLQAYLRALGPAGATTFARRHLSKEGDLLAAARHPAAAHVLFALLDLVDPATHAALCHTLAPHCAALATHVNGRFVVEKLVAASREVREGLARAFASLAKERGTQHVLCALVHHLDARGRRQVVETVGAQLREFATHASASVALQKLMQAEPEVLEAVRARLKADAVLRNELALNFFGKYVVQIALPGKKH